MIATAVFSTVCKGRRERRTTTVLNPATTVSTTRPTPTSSQISRSTVAATSASDFATMTVPVGVVLATTRQPSAVNGWDPVAITSARVSAGRVGACRPDGRLLICCTTVPESSDTWT